MKNAGTLILLLVLTVSCVTKTISLNGNWRQIFEGFKGEKEGFGIISDSALVLLNLKTPYQIQFDYQNGLNLDQADSIHYLYPKLVFRKLNYNKTFNRYDLNYDENCDCFHGWFQSFLGNQVNVKWVRN